MQQRQGFAAFSLLWKIKEVIHAVFLLTGFPQNCFSFPPWIVEDQRLELILVFISLMVSA